MRHYGTETFSLPSGAARKEDLGEDFLWRRTRLGLRLDPQVHECMDGGVRALVQAGAEPGAAAGTA